MYSKRTIPVNKDENFEPPSLIPRSGLVFNDYFLVKELRKELVRNGVISDNTSFDTDERNKGIEGLAAIIDEANKGAKSEKDFCPETYDQDVIDEVERIDEEQEVWENPILDGIDDYGNVWFST